MSAAQPPRRRAVRLADVSFALAEVAAAAADGEAHPVLSPAAQAQLVAAYQAGVAAGRSGATGGRPSAARAAAQQAEAHGLEALRMLVDANLRLVYELVWERAKKRWGPRGAAEHLDDLVGEGHQILLECAAEFDPARGPSFPTFLAHRLRTHLRIEVASEAGGGTMPDVWQRAARVARGVIAELTPQLGRAPTIGELQDEMTQRCLDHARTRKLKPEQLALPAEQVAELCRRDVVKSGWARAITEIETILTLTQTPLTLDGPSPQDGGSGALPDEVSVEEQVLRSDDRAEFAALLEVGMRGLSTTDRHIVIARFAEVDGADGTFERIASRFGVPAAHARRVIREVQNRLVAPHAQYCHLGGSVLDQVEVREPTRSFADKARGRARALRTHNRIESDAATRQAAALAAAATRRGTAAGTRPAS